MSNGFNWIRKTNIEDDMYPIVNSRNKINDKTEFCLKNVKVESNIAAEDTDKTLSRKKKHLKTLYKNPIKSKDIHKKLKKSMILASSCLRDTSGKIGELRLCESMAKEFSKEIDVKKTYKFTHLPKTIREENIGFTIINNSKTSKKLSYIKKEIIEENKFSNKIIAEIGPGVRLQRNSEMVQIIVNKTDPTKTKKGKKKLVYNVLSCKQENTSSETHPESCGEKDIDSMCEENAYFSSLTESASTSKSEKNVEKYKIFKSRTNKRKNGLYENPAKIKLKPNYTRKFNEQDLYCSSTSSKLIENNNFQSFFDDETQFNNFKPFEQNSNSLKTELELLEAELLMESRLNPMSLQHGTPNVGMNIDENEVILIDDDTNDNADLLASTCVLENLPDTSTVYIVTDDFVKEINNKTELNVQINYEDEESSNQNLVNILSTDNKIYQPLNNNLQIVHNVGEIFVENEEIVEVEPNIAASDSTTNLINIPKGTKICPQIEEIAELNNTEIAELNSIEISELNTDIALISETSEPSLVHDNDTRLSKDMNNCSSSYSENKGSANETNNKTDAKESDNNNHIIKDKIFFNSDQNIRIPAFNYDIENEKINVANIIEKKMESTKQSMNENLESNFLSHIQLPSEPAIEINACFALFPLQIYKVIEIEISDRELYKNVDTKNLTYPLSMDPRLNPRNVETSIAIRNVETAIAIRNEDPRTKSNRVCVLNSSHNIMQIFDKYLQRSTWYQSKGLLQKDEINIVLSELALEITKFREIKPKHIKVELEKNVHVILKEIGIEIDASGCIREQSINSKYNEQPSILDDSKKNKVDVVYRYEYYYNPSNGFFPPQPQNFPPHRLTSGPNYQYVPENNVNPSSSICSPANSNHNESQSQNHDFNNDKYGNFNGQPSYRDRNPFKKFNGSDNQISSYTPESNSDTYQNKNNKFNNKPRRFDNFNSENTSGYKYNKSRGGGRYKDQEDSNRNDDTYEVSPRPSFTKKNENTNSTVTNSYHDWDKAKEESENGPESTSLGDNFKETLDTNIVDSGRPSTPNWDED